MGDPGILMCGDISTLECGETKDGSDAWEGGRGKVVSRRLKG